MAILGGADIPPPILTGTESVEGVKALTTTRLELLKASIDPAVGSVTQTTHAGIEKILSMTPAALGIAAGIATFTAGIYMILMGRPPWKHTGVL
ncbi:MAG: hypothetical protein WCX61_04305 [Candidatus Peribacteraceae bacterium]|jgi:hypothetical protein